MLTRALAPASPAQDRHTRAAVKKGEDMGLRAQPRSGARGVRQAPVRLHRAHRGPGRGHLRPAGIHAPDPGRAGREYEPDDGGTPAASASGDTADAMAGWQITLIAVGAAVAAATAAVLLDRARGRPPGRRVMTRLPSGHQAEPRDSRRGMTAHGLPLPGRRTGNPIWITARPRQGEGHGHEPGPHPAGQPRAR